MLFSNNTTFGKLCQKYRVNSVEFLAEFPVQAAGNIDDDSFLEYIGSQKFQKDQNDLLLDLEDALYHEEGIDSVLISRSPSGIYSLAVKFLPWEIS